MFTAVPTDTELYCDGMIEVPSYGGRCGGLCDLGGLPGTQLDYAGPCQNGCQPGMEMMNMPMDIRTDGHGTHAGSRCRADACGSDSLGTACRSSRRGPDDSRIAAARTIGRSRPACPVGGGIFGDRTHLL